VVGSERHTSVAQDGLASAEDGNWVQDGLASAEDGDCLLEALEGKGS
jgi:hypothetical protein